MNFINKLERKFGRFAISNLTLYIIGCYVVGYLLSMLNVGGSSFLNYLTLEPSLILKGQVWRIITWVVVPPNTLSIFTVIMIVFYYSIGSTLERAWGTFRYNLYIFTGVLATVIGAFVLYIIYYIIYGPLAQVLSFGALFSTYYINLSIFLAFAASFPDMEVRLYFLIPIKIKWLAYLDVAVLGYSMIKGSMPERVAIIASLLNFIVFYFGTRNYKRMSPKEVKRRHTFAKEAKVPKGITRHKCAICGRTEMDGDDLEFRFCSKCDGNYEYCQDHLFTHEHVKK